MCSFIPYVAAAVNDDKTLRTDTVDRYGRRRAGRQVGRARRPHPRSDGQHRFRPGRGRRAAGEPHALSRCSSRRSGRSSSRTPSSSRWASRRRSICSSRDASACHLPARRSTSSAGGRLSGKLGGYNVGLLNMQTESALDQRSGQVIAPANNFSVVRLQREVGRSNVGAHVRRPPRRRRARGARGLQPRLRPGPRVAGDAQRTRVRLHRPHRFTGRQGRLRLRGPRRVRIYPTRVDGERGLHAGRRRVQPGSRVPATPWRAGRPRDAYSLSYQPARWPWIRRIQPHANFSAYANLQNQLDSSSGHWHFFDIQTRTGARFGYLFETQQDRPRAAFTVYQDVTGPPGGDPARPVRVDTRRLRGPHQPERARVTRRCCIASAASTTATITAGA